MMRPTPCGRRSRAGTASHLILCGALLGSAAAPAHADLADELQTALNGLRGDEFAGTFSTSVLGVNVVVNMLGFAFCTPPTPADPPAAEPTPPLNLYGCQNDVVVSVDPVVGDTVAVVVSAQEVFVDLSITRDRTVLCGEFTPGTRTENAYLLTSVSAQALIWTELLEGCEVYRLVPGSVELTMGAFDLQSDDPCASFLSAFVGLLEPQLESEVATQIESVLTIVLRQRNHTVCGEVSRQAASWGSLKAGFGRE